MIKKSASIYAAGFIFGVVSSIIIIWAYPSLYYAFLEFLRQKVEVQGRLIKNFTLMIIVNNFFAAGIASFGGTFVSKIVNLFDGETAKKKAFFYFLPVGILFMNGEVLGLLAVLFKSHFSIFLEGIFPHGFFEIPAIILSGSIGLEISEEAKQSGTDFQQTLNALVKKKLTKFSVVIALIIIGGVLEGRVL